MNKQAFFSLSLFLIVTVSACSKIQHANYFVGSECASNPIGLAFIDTLLYVVDEGDDGIYIKSIDKKGKCIKEMKMFDSGHSVFVEKYNDTALLVGNKTMDKIFAYYSTSDTLLEFKQNITLSHCVDIEVGEQGELYLLNNYPEKSTIVYLSHTAQATEVWSEDGMFTRIAYDKQHNKMYVYEEGEKKIWRYDIHENGRLANQWAFHKILFDGTSLMKTTSTGHLIIGRNNKGDINIIRNDGKVIKRVVLTHTFPMEIGMNEKDGKIYVIFEHVHQIGEINHVFF